MNIETFYRSGFLFLLLDEQGHELVRYRHATFMSEYGISPHDFLTENENAACQDAADWWHNASETERQAIMDIAMSRIVNEIESLNDLRQAIQDYRRLA